MPYVLQEALAAFRRSPLLAALSMTMIALSLLVVSLFAIAAHNIDVNIERLEARVEVTAFLRDGTDAESIRAAQEQIKRNTSVRAVQYVSREQALEIARRELPEFQNLFGNIDTNPLPASIEISLHPHQKGPQVVRAIAQEMRRMPIVEDVRFGEDWLDKIFLLRRMAGVATVVLGAAFALVAALIIGAAIRIAIFARRDEITIMRLVGATDGFIRGPFLLEGLITGVLGAILSITLAFTIFKVLTANRFELAWIPDTWVLAIVLLGGVLGGLSSTVAVRRHLLEI